MTGGDAGRIPAAGGVRMSAQGEGHARIFQVGQGTQNITISETVAPRPVAVVVPVVGSATAVADVFVGREREVRTLLDGLAPTDQGPGIAVVSAVAGMGGVGKTALACHVAAMAVDRGWFTHAVMVDLHGYDPVRRIESGQVAGSLLRAFDVSGERIPLADGDQVTVYHQVLARFAEQGHRVLLVLDNVSTSDQVNELLPRHRTHRAVLTTRDTLTLPAARRVDLDVLEDGEAVALLEQAVAQQRPADRRVANDRQQAARLVAACGWLPLAVRITAALLADDTALTLTALTAELQDAAIRLQVLAHGERAVGAVFDLSWQHLQARNPEAARLLRWLVLNPGPDISLDAAAALADQTPAQVRPQLRILQQAHLVKQVNGRWRMHDLIRLHTAIRARESGEDATGPLTRVLRHYLRTARAADQRFRALPGQPVSDVFATREDAVAWFDTERANLIAAVALTATTQQCDLTAALSEHLSEGLKWGRHFADWVTVAEQAAQAVLLLNDPARHAIQLNNLGAALRCVGRFDEAIATHHRAIDGHRATGNRHGEGEALGNLGLALDAVGRVEEAIATQQHAVKIFRDTSDRRGEGRALSNLSTSLGQMGRVEEAITAQRHAVKIFREIGDRRGEGQALHNLGTSLQMVGRLGEAITAYRQDIAICRAISDRHGEGETLNNLGTAFQMAGRFDEAIPAHQEAAAIFQQTDDQHREGQALSNLGTALLQTGHIDQAQRCLLDAAAAFTSSGATTDATQVLNLLESVHRPPPSA